MRTLSDHKYIYRKKWLRLIYIASLLVMAVTGLGQLPLFKRYYIADIPGFGWTADYYLTHRIHYIGAIFLLALFSFIIADYFLVERRYNRLTAAAYWRIFFLAGIVVTGILRVLKNMPHIVFPPHFTFVIDITHLLLVIAFALSALMFKIGKKGWVIEYVQKNGRN